MWMVGYNESGADFNMAADYPFNGRKLRPLMPRPVLSTSPNNTSTANTTPCLRSTNIHHGNDFFQQYHNLASVAEQNKREFNTPPVVVSSRWNPTPEQLRALEELYRRGTRTPSAEQIQQITAQLRRFGKIEGKNVFYWFQNHKARERQKRRRQMESSSAAAADHDHHPRDFESSQHHDKRDLGTSRTVFEVEQTKNNWPPSSTNCTSTLAEESVSIQRAAAAAAGGAAKAVVAAECSRTDGWLQFDEGELQQRRNFMERNATWHMMQLPACPHPHPPHFINTQYPNNANASSTTTITTTRVMDQKLINKTSSSSTHDLSFFISPHHTSSNIIHLSRNFNTHHQDHVESQTLQLFPLRNGGDGHQKEAGISASAMNAPPPSQFFEFLPLKN